MPVPPIPQRTIRDFVSREILTAPRLSELTQGHSEVVRALANMQPFPEEQPQPPTISVAKVRPTADVSGKPGWYTGYVVTDVISPGSALSLTGGVINQTTGEDIIIINWYESADGSGHSLTDSSPEVTDHMGYFAGYSTDEATPRRVFYVFANDFDTCEAGGTPPAPDVPATAGFLLMGS